MSHGESPADLKVQSTVTRARRNTVGDILAKTSARYPKKTALVYEGERLTYKDFDQRVNQTTHVFHQDGIGHGTKVAILSRNSLDFSVVSFALARMGAVLVPINYMLTVQDIAYILDHAQITAFIASLEFASTLDAAFQASHTPLHLPAELAVPQPQRYLMEVDSVPESLIAWNSLRSRRMHLSSEELAFEVREEDLAQVLYTSGTESRPKGVMLTHVNLISEYVSCIVDGRMEPSDVAIHALPLYHSAQLNCFLGPGVYIGASGIILGQASPAVILETIEREKITQLFCPPTVWIALLRHPDFTQRDLSSLEKCYYGAAIMPMEVLKELSAKLPQAKFWNFYGQTEVAPLATALQPEDQIRKLGSAGRPVLNVETKIVDDDGHEVPSNSIGEIVHRTSHAMLGYLNDPVKTAEAFQDGWFHSGDLGVMDEDGYLTVIDRKKDMIKSGGVNVASREVEEAIYQFEGVSEVAVIGVQDTYWIEAVTAVVVPKPGVTLHAEALMAHCKAQLAKFKVPKHIVITDALPRNPSGKILKRDLREAYKDLGMSS